MFLLSVSDNPVLTPAGIATVSAHVPVNNRSFVCYNLVGPLLAFRAGVSGTYSMVASLKS